MTTRRATTVACIGAALSLQATTADAQTRSLDDGYLFVGLVDDPRANPVGNSGWRPWLRLNAMGQIDNAGAFRIVVRKGSRTLMTANCSTSGTAGADAYMYHDACGYSVNDWGRSPTWIQDTGEFAIDVKYVNTDTDQESLLRTLTIRVGVAGNVSPGNFRPTPSRYYVDSDGELLDTLIHAEAAGASPYCARSGEAGRHTTDFTGNHLALYLFASTTDLGAGITNAGGTATLRCTVNGRPVNIPDHRFGAIQVDQMWAQGTARPRSGNELVRTAYDWRRLRFSLPITWGAQSSRPPNTVALEDNPGTWQCELRSNGQTLRVFQFDVANGAVQPHPEERTGGLRLFSGVHLAQTWLTNAPLANERPYAPELLRQSGFYGRRWVTAEARSAAQGATGRPPAIATGAANTPASGGSTPAGAAPAVRYLPAYTWFEATNNVTPINGNPTNQGWTLSAAAQVRGAVPNQSAFKFVLRQGRNTLGTLRCVGRRNVTTGDTSNTTNILMTVSNCGNLAEHSASGPQRLTAMGDVSVDVFFVDGQTDRETQLSTHTINIRVATRIRGNRQADAGLYYVNQNAESAVAILQQGDADDPRLRPLPEGQLSTFANGAGGRIWIEFRASRAEGTVGLHGPQSFRCRVNGAVLDLANRTANIRSLIETTVTHTRASTTANPTREPMLYGRYLAEFALTFGPRLNTDMFDISTRPGSWECDLRVGDETIRTFRFVVGDRGVVQPHPEQSAGLYLEPGQALVDSVIPANTAWDARTEPSASRAGAFYGRPWSSPQARAAAAAIPAVGNAHPPASDRRP